MSYRTGNIIKMLLVGLTLVFFFSGCSTLDRILGRGVDETDPSELMAHGMSNLEGGRYKDAVKDFELVRDRYPYSKYAVTAELKLADALYRTGERDQAYEAYDQFEKLHPKHSEIPYVVYQKGMCHFDQMTTTDREQLHTQKARDEFERIIQRFPRDQYASLARKNLRKCLIYLATYEIYVGDFYFKKGYYRAALARYTYLIEHYPDMGQYHLALEKISKCKEQIALEKPLTDKDKAEKDKSWYGGELNLDSDYRPGGSSL